jgi:hypothetical protein
MRDLDDSMICDAASTLLASLRRAEGLDELAARSLVEALLQARDSWHSSSVVPKRAASLFLDLESGLEATTHSYEGPCVSALWR